MRTAGLNELLIEHLKEAGLRVTPQRLAIFHALVSTGAHPTAQTLFEQLITTLPSLSRATVYNTLRVLTAHNLIQEVGEAGDGAVHYDGNPTPHVNLICVECQCIEDLFEMPLDRLAELVAERSEYQVHGIRVSTYGVCPGCHGRRTEVSAYQAIQSSPS